MEATLNTDTTTQDSGSFGEIPAKKWYKNNPYIRAGAVVLEVVTVIAISAFAYRAGRRAGYKDAELGLNPSIADSDIARDAIANAMAPATVTVKTTTRT